MARKAVNEIIPGKLYQRGQILTWKYDEKVALFDELNIGLVVNFWPKVDSDLSNTWYFHLPSSSDDMISMNVDMISRIVARYLKYNDKAALILCEAGKTRSVYFSTLVRAYYMKEPPRVAWAEVSKILPGSKLKPFMLEMLT